MLVRSPDARARDKKSRSRASGLPVVLIVKPGDEAMAAQPVTHGMPGLPTRYGLLILPPREGVPD